MVSDAVTIPMCGRFTLTTTNEELMHRFGIRLAQNLQPRYNIAPSQSTLITRPNIQNQVTNYRSHYGTVWLTLISR